MDLNERIKCLEGVDLFRFFSAHELSSFAEKISEVKFNKGDVIFHEGELGKDMYVLLEGRLKIFKESRIITELQPVDYVGEMAIIETKPRSATVQAMEPCLMLKITYEQFDKYLVKQPNPLVSMMKTLSHRIRDDTETIASEFEKVNILIHDMKNMLAVFQFLEPLKKEIVKEPGKRYLNYLHNAKNNLAAMMEEAMVNAKRLYQLPTFTMGTLSELIKDLIESELQLHPDLINKKITVNIDDDLIEFSFSRLDIRRVLANLIINAGQASKSGGSIEIEVTHKDTIAEVRVRDHGCGIPEQYHDRIFKTYYTTKKNGCGLGLASCQQIIKKMHHGTISFHSNPSEGTTFIFTLPLTS